MRETRYLCRNMPHESISVKDIFKIGIGPSSSHTLGPWRAAQRFTDSIRARNGLAGLQHVSVLLYGSLAKTGKGHGTDIAIQLGLAGEDPVTFDTGLIDTTIQTIRVTQKLVIRGERTISFDPDTDISFLFSETLPYHPNAMTFLASWEDGREMAETWYSIGGGFVKKEGEETESTASVQLPFPIDTASDLLHWCRKTGLTISEVVLENEAAWRPEEETRRDVRRIWRTMQECIYRGCHSEGMLPGGLHVQRRAASLLPRSAWLGRCRIMLLRRSWSSGCRTLTWSKCMSLRGGGATSTSGNGLPFPSSRGSACS